MNIDELIGKIIPPNTAQYRRDFYNVPIIKRLTDSERELIKDKLIDKLRENRCDILIYETLAYMDETKSVPEVYACFEHCDKANVRFFLACSIYQLAKDEELIDLIISNFKKQDCLPNRDLSLPFFFGPLWKIKHPEIIDLVNQYVNDSDYVISWNAKKALEHIERDE